MNPMSPAIERVRLAVAHHFELLPPLLFALAANRAEPGRALFTMRCNLCLVDVSVGIGVQDLDEFDEESSINLILRELAGIRDEHVVACARVALHREAIAAFAGTPGDVDDFTYAERQATAWMEIVNRLRPR